MNVDVSMPGILSTTYGDPKEHNYVKGKTVVWDIAVPEDSEGKGLGTNNQSEQEMSFPIGTVLHVTQILVRQADKAVPSIADSASASGHSRSGWGGLHCRCNAAPVQCAKTGPGRACTECAIAIAKESSVRLLPWNGEERTLDCAIPPRPIGVAEFIS